MQIDDAAIQVYKDGDYGAYLDLESSLAEQTEEIEGLQARWVQERPKDLMIQHIVIGHFEVLATTPTTLKSDCMSSWRNCIDCERFSLLCDLPWTPTR